MLPSTGRVSSTNASGSKPRSNTKNDRIPQPSNCNTNVKNVALSKNLDTICLSCNECLFSANHDACVVQYLKKMQKRKVAKSTKQKENCASSSSNDTSTMVVPPGHILTTTVIPVDIVEIVLWYLDSGCSKHITGHRDKLINFVSKFIGTVRFDNDHFAAIMGYGDLQIGNILISRVYNIEGLGHNLFSIGKFCDSDFEAAFRKHTCFVRNLEGVDLLSGSRGSNL
ncbi:hypothetical protein Tco_0666149 [Tanacetum coccineum]